MMRKYLKKPWFYICPVILLILYHNPDGLLFVSLEYGRSTSSLKWNLTLFIILLMVVCIVLFFSALVRVFRGERCFLWDTGAYILLFILMLGMMLPPVGCAREQQRRLSCADNLRRLYSVLRQYADDSGSFPPDLNMLQGIKPKIFRCPSRQETIPDFSDYSYHGNGKKVNDDVFLLLEDRTDNHLAYRCKIYSDGTVVRTSGK